MLQWKNYCIVAVFIYKSQPDRVLEHKITVECEFRWRWNNYSATVVRHLTDKFCYLPLRDGHA
jgi:hypothetical protein